MPNLSIWTSPLVQREIDCLITQDRLQLYIRPHRLDAGAGHDGKPLVCSTFAYRPWSLP